MPRFLVTLFLGSFLLSGSAFCAEPSSYSLGLFSYGIRFPDGTGQDTAALPSLPANMAWVAHAGGKYTSPVDAMAHLADWCVLGGNVVPVDARCTLLIAPGIYELGADQLIMRAGVDIVGMGVRTTVLSGAVDSAALGEESALIRGADHTTLRDLTVVNAGAQHASSGIYNVELSFIIKHAEVVVSGNASLSTGIENKGFGSKFSDITVSATGLTDCVGIRNTGNGSIIINRASISASGCAKNTAITNLNAVGLRLADVNASATATGAQRAVGLWSSGSGLTVLDSKLEGATYSLGIGSTSARIINTQLDGPVGANSAGTQCWGTYDSNLADRGC